MSESLTLVSINVERDEHLDLVLPFLNERQPDVACLQEVREEDVQKFLEAVPGEYIYAPALRHRSDNFKAIIGECIISRLPLAYKESRYYVGDPTRILNEELPQKFANRVLIMCETTSGFRIATTHFTWTSDGKPTDAQRADMQKLLAALETSGQFVLTGDFNAPRGGEIFAALAARYKDNVPFEYKTTLDLNLHHASPEVKAARMVDGIFSTPGYVVSQVEMISGVSDHCALVATVTRAD